MNNFSDFIYISRLSGQNRTHVFDREISLHVSCLISHASVRGGVSFVESVGGKRLDKRPEFDGLFFCHSILNQSRNQFLFLKRHFGWDFFTHRFSKFVGFEPRVSSKMYRNKHDIVLVGDDSV